MVSLANTGPLVPMNVTRPVVPVSVTVCSRPAGAASKCEYSVTTFPSCRNIAGVTEDDWVAERSREFASLCGRRVESWTVATGGGPEFADPWAHCLQMLGLQVRLDDDAVWSVNTCEGGTASGLWAVPEARFRDKGLWGGIHRWRALAELPLGQVKHVAVFADEGVLAQVNLEIGERPLLLIADALDETGAKEHLIPRAGRFGIGSHRFRRCRACPRSTSRRGLTRIGDWSLAVES